MYHDSSMQEAYTRVLIGAIELSLTVWPFGLHGEEFSLLLSWTFKILNIEGWNIPWFALALLSNSQRYFSWKWSAENPFCFRDWAGHSNAQPPLRAWVGLSPWHWTWTRVLPQCTWRYGKPDSLSDIPYITFRAHINAWHGPFSP